MMMTSKISCKETFSGLLSKFIFVSSPDGELEFWQIILDLGINNKKIKLLNNVKLVYIHSQQTMFWNGNSSLNQNNKNRLKRQAGLCLKSNVQSNYIYVGFSTAWEISSEVSIWLIVPIVHLWVRIRENTWSIINSDSNSERIYNQPLERSLPGQHVICCICFLVAWKTQLLLLFCEPRDPEGNDLA